MATGWQSSRRKEQLPSDWSRLRSIVLKRAGGRCEAMTPQGRCPARASDVDHKQRGNDHSLGNLQALCRKHHSVKSSLEGYAAMAKRRKEAQQRFRRSEPHPAEL